MYIHHYILPINTTSLLLFHPSFSSLSFTPPSSPSPSHHPAPSSSSENESTPPVIVQVRIKPANQKIIDELAIFYLNQFEITRAIEALIEVHISTQNQPEGAITVPTEIEIEGDGYMLVCTRKPWSFGKTISVEAGDVNFRTAEDKWNVVIHCTSAGLTRVASPPLTN